MESNNISESVATLRFGEKCLLIENEASSGSSMLAGVLKALDAQIAELEATIKSKEKWIDTEERRVDTNAEEGTIEEAIGFEIRKVTKLVGAEIERQQLEILLKRRDQFIGVMPLGADEDDIASDEDALATDSATQSANATQPTRKTKRTICFDDAFERNDE